MYFCPVFFTAEKPEAQGESSLFSTRPPVHYPKHTCPFSIPCFFQCRRCFSCRLPFFFGYFQAICDHQHAKKIAKENKILTLSSDWVGLLCGNIRAKCRVPVRSLHACMWIVFPYREPTHTVCEVPPAWLCSQPCHKIMWAEGRELQPPNPPRLHFD